LSINLFNNISIIYEIAKLEAQFKNYIDTKISLFFVFLTIYYIILILLDINFKIEIIFTNLSLLSKISLKDAAISAYLIGQKLSDNLVNSIFFSQLSDYLPITFPKLSFNLCFDSYLPNKNTFSTIIF
jgi:hypothetical protein